MGGVIDDMYNVPDVETKRDQALIEKANKASKMIWVTFRTVSNTHMKHKTTILVKISEVSVSLKKL